MAETYRCPRCGAQVPGDAPQGLCPNCVLEAGLQTGSVPPTGAESASAGSFDAHFVPPTPTELTPHFPDLEILELVGQGGMGVVYKARQKSLDRLVALKILAPKIGQDPAFAERFAREARAMGMLSHPQIVAVHDFGQTTMVAEGEGQVAMAAPLYYFLMEYVDGVNLRRLLDTGTLAPEQALAIVPQICGALQYAHDHGVVHRDIKPENVLLDKDGRVKIADFGLAKLVGREAKAAGGPKRTDDTTTPASDGASYAADESLTHAGQVLGTPQYMAPEQIERPLEVDHRADIYSLGVVFYQMLTGELPAGPFSPPSTKVQIDVRLDEVVLRALEREPQRRYQQASEIKTQVETIASTASEHRPPPAGTADIEQSRREVRGPAFGLLITGMLNCLCIPAAILWLSLDMVEEPPPPPGVVETITGITTIVASLFACLIPGVFMISAALKMRRLQAYGQALAASVLAIITSPVAFLVGLPIGIWALVVLCQREVRAAFAPNRKRAARKDGASEIKTRVETIASTPAEHRHPSAGADDTIDEPQREVRWPAIGLLVTGMLNCLGLVLLFLWNIAAGAKIAAVAGEPYAPPSGVVEFVMQLAVLFAGVFVCLIPGVFMILAALKMKRLQAYRWAVGASVLAIITSPVAFLIGLPVGIWTLVVLCQREVRAAFAPNRKRTARKAGAQLVKQIVAQMTVQEKAALRKFDTWNWILSIAIYVPPLAIIFWTPVPLNWIIAPVYLFTGLALYRLRWKSWARMLCSTEWATERGIEPESMYRIGSSGLMLWGVLVLLCWGACWWRTYEPVGVWTPYREEVLSLPRSREIPFRVAEVSQREQIVLVKIVCEPVSDSDGLFAALSGLPSKATDALAAEVKGLDCLLATEEGSSIGNVLVGTNTLRGKIPTLQIGFVLPDQQAAAEAIELIRTYYLGRPCGVSQADPVVPLFSLRRRTSEREAGKPVYQYLHGSICWSTTPVAREHVVAQFLRGHNGWSAETAAKRPFEARLPNGVTVELVGVAEHPSKDRPWWKPDGTPLAQRPYDWLGASVVVGKDEMARELAVRLGNTPAEPVDVQWRIEPSLGISQGTPPRLDDDSANLHGVAARIRAGQQTADVCIGVAAGPWQFAAESQPLGGDAHGGKRSVLFSPAEEKDGSVTITIAHDLTNAEGGGPQLRVTIRDVQGPHFPVIARDLGGPQVRVKAVDSDGREHDCESIVHSRAGRLSQLTATFSNLSLKDVQTFRLLSRPYQWAEFRNVSLHPSLNSLW